MKLSAPWYFFYKELKALFDEDPEIKAIFNEEEMEIKLFVSNGRKADALQQLLPEEKTFGNVTLRIAVVPANDGMTSATQLFEDAFMGNPVLSDLVHLDTPLGSFDYAVFRKEVVQFFNDDLSDINGNCSTLYQDIAKDVFDTGIGVYFCTDATDPNLIKPLGEWP